MRSTISPAFTGSKMRTMFVLMREIAEEFVNHYTEQCTTEDTLTIDVKESFKRCTTDLIASCAFGMKINSLKEKNNEFYLKSNDAVSIKSSRMIKILLYFAIPNILKFFRIRVIEETLQDYFKDVVLRNMAYREKNDIIRPDMIHLLMEARKGRLKYEENVSNEENNFASVQEINLDQRTTKEGKYT